MSFKEVYNSQRLIAEIKRRPGLYDPSLALYTDKVHRSKLWEEVCDAVVDNWRMLDKGEKAVKERDVQKRWKSLRDCFKRELLLQEKIRRSGMALHKKRKYLYFDSLSFLLPNARCRRTNKCPKEENVNIRTEAENSEMNTSNECTANEDNKDETFVPEIREIDLLKTSTVYKLPNASKSSDDDLTYSTDIGYEKGIIDDDKAFLVSLLPTLRKFNDDQKFRVRMLMMDVVRQVQLGYSPRLVTHPNEHVNSANHVSNSLILDRPIKVESIDVKTEEIIEENHEFMEN